MKKALIIIAAIILVAVIGVLFMIERPAIIKTTQYENLRNPRITEMANQKVIEVDLFGNPNETAPKAMMQLLLAFYKLRSYGNSIAQPLPRTRWYGDSRNMQTLLGKYAMQVSDNVTQPPDWKDSQIKLTTWEYGTVAEILHVGPYSEIWPTTQKLIKYIKNNGYQIIGEIEAESVKGPDLLHLVKPEDYQTIIRYQVAKR